MDAPVLGTLALSPSRPELLAGVVAAALAARPDLASVAHGGITPIGLPDGWPVLVDAAVATLPWAVVGSGVRRSKLVLPGQALASLPGAEVVEGLGRPLTPA